ncbi:hypothetical protein ABIE56_000322 [Luteibacter sp. 621]|uniref:hypothetical protein n=1 Tax=Luteibacter sp. 621 TaxID=3373916 RepID=UPI003D206A2C
MDLVTLFPFARRLRPGMRTFLYAPGVVVWTLSTSALFGIAAGLALRWANR